jgi:putative hydrolase
VSDGPGSSGGGDFLSKMLGDLLRLMPTGSGFQWPLAYQLAASAAAADSPDPNPDPRERIRLEELSAIAELHVTDVTGMRLSPAGKSPVLVPTSRSEWARRTLDSWRPVLEQLSSALSGRAPVDRPYGTQSGASDLARPEEPEDAGAPDAQLAELFGRWATAVMPMMIAMQVGSAVGHLAGRALGQYEIPLAPAPGDEILVVSTNLAQVAADWSLPPDDLSLWLCVHEMAHHAVLSRPHVAARLAALVVAHAETVRPDPAALEELMAGGNPSDMSSMLELFGDPSAISASADSREVQVVRAQLDALTAAISGYAEHVTTTVANRLIGGHAPIGEAMRRRRVGRGDGEKVAEQLFGLRLDQDQVDRGARFVEGVLERSGDAELARLWIDEASLPTPPEIDAPGLWLARLDLGSETPGSGAGPDPDS